MGLRVIACLFVFVGHHVIGGMHGLLTGLLPQLHALHVKELALNSRIRARVIVAVDAVFVLQQLVQRVPVDVVPALEIGIDQS